MLIHDADHVELNDAVLDPGEDKRRARRRRRERVDWGFRGAAGAEAVVGRAARVEEEVPVAAVVFVLVVEVAADAAVDESGSRWLGWLTGGGGGAGRQVDGVVGFAAGHAQVEDFHGGVAGAAGDEALAAEREERVDGG